MISDRRELASPKVLVISGLLLLLLISALPGLPWRLGYLDLGVYQLPAFLLLRYVSAVRQGVAGLATLALVSFFIPVPAGLFVEAASFILLLLVIDAFANSGRAEHRLTIGLSTLLLISFPFYTAVLTLLREEGLLFAATHAASFVFSTVFSLVIAELLWAISIIAFSGFFQGFARHNEDGRVSIRSLGTVFISVLVATIFFLFLQIWSARWEAVLTTTTRDLVDQTAQSRLSNDLHQVELETRSASVRFSQQEGPWLYLSERFVIVGINAAEDLTSENPLSLVGNERMGNSDELIRFIDTQLAKFKYRASMGVDFAKLPSPLFLDFNAQKLPVYTDVINDLILFVIDTSPDRLQADQASDRIGLSIRRISAANQETLNLDQKKAHIIDSDWMGGVLWNGVSGAHTNLSRLGAVTKDTNLSVAVSSQFAQAFDLQLPSTELLVVDLAVWPRLQVFFRAATTMALFLTVSLLLTSLLTSYLVGLLIKPITRLLEGLEELKDTHIQTGEANAAIKPIEIESKALSLELNNLQDAIVWFSNEVATADHQLRSAVTGYEALLSSLPLGVMEIDRDYQLRFRNDAMSEITGDSAEASYRLRLRAEQLFESGETIDEYALSLEDQPQRNLLLAITPRKNEAGEDSGFWLLVTDLTKQKAMDSQLLQTAKLATLGEMSTGMAHELNQPLNIIKLALSNLTNSIKKGRATEESMMSRLERIDSAVDRAATIIDHMRAFGRVAGEDFAPFDIVASVNAASDLVREPMAAKGVDLVNLVEESTWVQGNTIQFEQVLLNMVNNARDAILDSSTSGVVTLRQIREEGVVTITIDDTGGGIPSEVLPHIFEPFYTTKAVGKGTGLGGSISYGIIQDMQGTIWAENIGEGARISIRLPIYTKETETVAEMDQ